MVRYSHCKVTCCIVYTPLLLNQYFVAILFTDFLIGRDTVLAELEPLSELLDSLPHKVQFGARNLMGHVWEKTKEHGVKNLFHALRESAQDNFKSLTIEYTCLDVSFDAIVLGTNLGIVLLYDRTCRRLSRLPSEVCLIFFLYNLKLNIRKNIVILTNAPYQINTPMKKTFLV